MIKIRCFAKAAEIVGGKYLEVDSKVLSVQELKTIVLERFPEFEHLDSVRIAVNEAYADDAQSIKEGDDVVIIPPVSGG